MGFLLHHSIEESADRSPGHEAFRCDGAALTYEQLVHRAAQVAAILADAGIRRGDRVGIYMLKSLELPVALYGVLMAGAAYVPIDPGAPASRVRFILEDCGIRHLITNASRERRTADLVDGVSPVRAVLGAARPPLSSAHCEFVSWDDIARAGCQAPSARATELDLAYIMYTSGSTGAPKGLMHTHASGLSYARLSARTYDVGPRDRMGNHSPLHFDMSTFEYLTVPLCGATTVIIPEETTMFPASLGALIERERLTFWYSVPLALIQLVTHGVIERLDARSLRWVLFGGEPFPPKYLWTLMARWPHARFSNVYGPAEVNQCTCYHVPTADCGSRDPVPLGRIWENADGMVVDAAGAEVPRGEPGELLVCAPTMMAGYWARPDLNGAAFADLEPWPGFRKRFYRTGDLVREREDGNLQFLGRKDRQIKVRGHRVELDEIETVIGAFDDVAEIAAIVLRDAEENAVILAVVIPRAGGPLQPDDVRRRAAGRLPPYAVPARVDIRDAFPRTATGKIDRRALAEMYQEAEPT